MLYVNYNWKIENYSMAKKNTLIFSFKSWGESRLCLFDSVVPLILSITPHSQHHSPRYSHLRLRSGVGGAGWVRDLLPACPSLTLFQCLGWACPLAVNGKEVRSCEAGWGTGGKSHLCPCFHQALFCKVPEGAGTPCFLFFVLSLRKQLSWGGGKCGQIRSYMLNLINSGKASTVGLTSPETKVTTWDGLNIKIPN